MLSETFPRSVLVPPSPRNLCQDCRSLNRRRLSGSAWRFKSLEMTMSDRNWERVAHQEASPPSRQLLATRTEEAHIATHVQQATKCKGHRQRNVLLEGAAGTGQPQAKTKKQGLKRSARYPAVLGDGLQRMEAVLKAVQKKLKKEWLSGHEILSNGVRWSRVLL